jgi:hypothetical protein
MPVYKSQNFSKIIPAINFEMFPDVQTVLNQSSKFSAKIAHQTKHSPTCDVLAFNVYCSWPNPNLAFKNSVNPNI